MTNRKSHGKLDHSFGYGGHGVFTLLTGTFRCLKCWAESERRIQTYLFKTDFHNNARCYDVGDSEVIDGIDEFDPLWPWDGQSPLVIAIGDWDCRQCGLSYQWAKLTLEVSHSSAGLIGTVKSVETLIPVTVDALLGIHGLEPHLAALSWGFGEGVEDYHWPIGNKGDLGWATVPVEQRCSLLVSGFRAWCIEVARVDPAEIPPTASGSLGPV